MYVDCMVPSDPKFSDQVVMFHYYGCWRHLWGLILELVALILYTIGFQSLISPRWCPHASGIVFKDFLCYQEMFDAKPLSQPASTKVENTEKPAMSVAGSTDYLGAWSTHRYQVYLELLIVESWFARGASYTPTRMILFHFLSFYHSNQRFVIFWEPWNPLCCCQDTEGLCLIRYPNSPIIHPLRRQVTSGLFGSGWKFDICFLRKAASNYRLKLGNYE